jgi:hypothetical protein
MELSMPVTDRHRSETCAGGRCDRQMPGAWVSFQASYSGRSASDGGRAAGLSLPDPPAGILFDFFEQGARFRMDRAACGLGNCMRRVWHLKWKEAPVRESGRIRPTGATMALRFRFWKRL